MGIKPIREKGSNLRIIFDKVSQSSYSVPIEDEATDIAEFLLAHPVTREFTIKICRERILCGERLDHFSESFVRALASGVQQEEDADPEYSSALRQVLDSERVRLFLEREAFQADGNFRFVGNKAMSIRGLGAFKLNKAYAASLNSLRKPEAHDREFAPYTLLDIDPERAVGDLIMHLASEDSIVMRTTIARALASHQPSTIPILLERVGDNDHTMRRAVCFALGFAQPSSEVEIALRSCLQDSYCEVYECACESLNRLYRADCTAKLVDAFAEESDTSRCWLLLDAAVELGDCGDSQGPALQWTEGLSKSLTPLMADHASDLLKKRRNKEMTELKREDEKQN